MSLVVSFSADSCSLHFLPSSTAAHNFDHAIIIIKSKVLGGPPYLKGLMLNYYGVKRGSVETAQFDKRNDKIVR